jgi:glutamate/tyrosine decarboxylase-like PLP-dependent enzyme
MGNFTALGAARHTVLERVGWDVEHRGLAGAPPIRVLAGEEAHVTVVVALRLLGLGIDSVEQVATDAQGRMRPDALEDRLSRSRGPAIVCAQAGNIDTGAIDPLGEIAMIARRHGAWCHVDGAFGLWAAASPSHREQTSGIEHADSWVADAHKWLNVPYDQLRHRQGSEPHRAAMALTAAYLPRAAEGDRWPAEWVPELSRSGASFPGLRGVAIAGRQGVSRIVENCCERAAQLAELLANVPGVQILNDVTLNQVLVRFSDDDAVTDAATLSRSGRRRSLAWWDDLARRRAMRVSICNWATTAADMSAQRIDPAAARH